MSKRKTFSTLIAVAVLLCAIVAFGVQCAFAETANVAEVSEGFVFDEANPNTVVGVNLPSGISGSVKLVVPSNVTSIGARAFEGMSNLTKAVLPQGLTTIGAYAFANTALASVTVPNTVTAISEHAFNGCTALRDVTFAEGRTEKLTIAIYAFASCSVLGTVSLPQNTEIRQSAFVGCTSLLWVYVGEGCVFNAVGVSDAVFFPSNTAVAVVFPSKSAYEKAIADSDAAFKNNNGKSLTYIVNVNCFVGNSQTPVVYERLHGREFNYVKDGYGIWNTDTKFSSLPVQHESYASTVWYAEREFTNVVSYEKVNGLLASADVVNLYCHETVLAPTFPTEPVSWVSNDKISYDSSDISQVLKAMGCESILSDAQLQAISMNVLFADENGNASKTPDKIGVSGVYSVTLTLDPSYGTWAQTVGATITVNVDTKPFNIVLIVFLVVGVLAVVVTVSTAIIRKKVQSRNQKKQLTKQEVLEKFKAAGGETTIIK